MLTCDDCEFLGSDSIDIGEDEICYHVCDHGAFKDTHEVGRETGASYGCARVTPRPEWCPKPNFIVQPIAHGMGQAEHYFKRSRVDRRLTEMSSLYLAPQPLGALHFKGTEA